MGVLGLSSLDALGTSQHFVGHLPGQKLTQQIPVVLIGLKRWFLTK